jgi:putative membrane-bound dehydrogenase-like protein
MTKRFMLAALVAEIWLSLVVSAAEFKFGTRTLTVPDGFEVELIAGPPLVDRPISADFDEEGRLYVTDSSGSNDPPEKQLKDKPHRVVRLEDTTGDGTFDRSIVFADRFMVPEGAMWYEGSVYVAAPPSIWKLTDTQGNGIADSRREWMQGKTLTGCANDLHGPYAGPDGWIYWCKGAFAKQTYERPGKEPFVTRAAHIFRCRPDGTGLEPVMTGGMDNPVGVAFTVTGERILCATFLQEPGGGKRDGLIHAVYGGVYGKVHDVIDEHPRTGDILPVLSHLGPAAPCCLITYNSDIFGRNFQDNLFTCCFNLHKVLRDQLIPDGATYKTIETDFLTSDDPDFHPTCVIEDADGSLIVIDTGGWYKLCCPTSQLAKPDVLGHIYRVRRRGAPKIEDPRGNSLDWAALSPADLIKFLSDPRPAVRKRAIRTLARSGDRSVESLAVALRNSTATEARRNALWALTQIDSAQARQAVRSALRDKDNTVRHVATQSISLWRDQDATASLLPLLQDEDTQVRRSAIEALGRIGRQEAVPALLTSAAQIDAGPVELPPGARILEHSIIFALMEIADRAATAEGLGSENPRVRRVALMAMDQMRHGHLDVEAVVPLLDSRNPVLNDTANWIVGRHQEWGGALAGFFQNRLKTPELSAAEVNDLQAQLVPFAKDPAIEQLLAHVLAESQSTNRARQVVLRVMAKAASKPLLNAWLEEVAATLCSPDVETVREAIATAGAFTRAKAGSPALDKALSQIGNNGNLAPEIRLEALAAAGPLEHLSTNLFSFLLNHLDPAKPWPLRNNAALVISKATLDRAQLLALADALQTVGPSEMPKLILPFETSSDETAGESLIENLKKAKSVSSLRPAVIKPVIEKFPAAVQARAGELLAMLGTDAAQQNEHLDQLIAQLPAGDIRRGQSVFNNPKFACISCHSVGYRGGHLGPDLTSVGTIRTERDLLESIVYPSASFVRSYEPMIVLTKDGDDYNGVLRKDGAEEVILATGPETEVHLRRSDIAEMRPGTVSLMPQGLETAFSRQELADLVAFLKNTKWGAR